MSSLYLSVHRLLILHSIVVLAYCNISGPSLEISSKLAKFYYQRARQKYFLYELNRHKSQKAKKTERVSKSRKGVNTLIWFAIDSFGWIFGSEWIAMLAQLIMNFNTSPPRFLPSRYFDSRDCIHPIASRPISELSCQHVGNQRKVHVKTTLLC